MTDGERIKTIIGLLGLSQKEFAEAIIIDEKGNTLSPSTLNQVLTGRRTIGGKFAKDVKKAFPQVSLDWLLTGTGFPLIDERLGMSNKDLINENNFLKSKLGEYRSLCKILVAKGLEFGGWMEETLTQHQQTLKEMENENA